MLDPAQGGATTAPAAPVDVAQAPVKRTFGGLTATVAKGFQQFDKPEGQSIVRGAYQALGAIEGWGRETSNPFSPDMGGAAHEMRREIEAEVAKRSGVVDRIKTRLAQIDNQLSTHTGTATTTEGLDAELKALTTERAQLEAQQINADNVQGFRREGSFNPMALLPGGEKFLGSPTDVSRVVTAKPFWGNVDADAFYLDPKIASTEITPEDMRTGALRNFMSGYAPVLEQDGKRYIDTPLGTFELKDFDRVYANRHNLITSMLGMDPSTMKGLEGFATQGSWTDALIKRATDATLPEGQQGKGFLWDVRTANPSMRLPFLPDLFGDGDLTRSWRFLQTPTGAATVRAVLEKATADKEIHPSLKQVIGQLTGFTVEVAAASELTGLAGTTALRGLKLAGPVAATKAAQLEHWYQGLAETGGWPGLRFGMRGMTDMTAHNVVRAAIDGEQPMKDAVLQGMAEALPYVFTSSFLARPLRKLLMKGVNSLAPSLALRATAQGADDIAAFIEALPSKQIDLRATIGKLVMQPALAQGINSAVDNAATMWLMGAYHAAMSDAGGKWDGMPIDAKALSVMRQMNSTEALGGMVFGGASSALAIGSMMKQLRGKFGDMGPEQQADITRMAYDALRHFAEPNDPKKFQTYTRIFEDLRAANPDYPFNTVEPFSPHESASSTIGVKQQADAMERNQASTTAAFGERIKKQDAKDLLARWKMVRVDGYEEGGAPTFRDGQPGEQARIMMPREQDEHSLAVKSIAGGTQFVIVDPKDPAHTYGNTPVWDSPVGAMIQAEAIARDARAAAAEKAKTAQPITEVPRLKKGRKPPPEAPPSQPKAPTPEPKPPTPKGKAPSKVPDEGPLFTPETEARVKADDEAAAKDRADWETTRKKMRADPLTTPEQQAQLDEIDRREARRTAKLPKDLAGAKPRYGYREDNFELTFESDMDRALFITSQPGKSKRDADYRTWLKGVGLSDVEIDARGKGLRDRVKSIAAQNRGQSAITIPIAPPFKRPATREEAQATSEAHATDPEHVGKDPAEIVDDVNRTLPQPETEAQAAEHRKSVLPPAPVGVDRERATPAVVPPAETGPRGGTGVGGAAVLPKERTGPKLSASVRQRALDKGNLREFIAALGGVKFQDEGRDVFERLGSKAGYKSVFGLGPVARGPKSKRGVYWEKALEAAVQAGFFPGKEIGQVSIDEFVDALENKHMRVEGEVARTSKAVKEHDVATEQEHEGYLDKARENATFLRVYDHDVKWQVDRHIREVIDNGATTPTLFAQAGTTAQQAASLLHGVGMISQPDAGSEEAQRAIYMLALEDGKKGLALDAFRAQIGQTFVDEAQAMHAYMTAHVAARGYLAYVQEAMVAGALLDLDQLRQVRAYFMFVEDRASGDGKLQDETRRLLKDAGMIEAGKLAPWVQTQMAQMGVEHLRNAQREGTDDEHTYMYAVDPFMALGMLGFQPSKTRGHEREFATQRAIEDVSRRGSLGQLILNTPNPISAALLAWDRNIARNVKGPFLPATAARAEWDYVNKVRTPIKSEIARVLYLTDRAMNTATAGGESLPQWQRSLLHDVIKSGLFRRLTGPDDLAKRFGEPARGLWSSLVAFTQATNEAGSLGVKYGFLTEGQFEARESAYMMSARMDVLEKSIVDRLKDGDVWAALGMAGRDMRQGDADRGIQVFDPYTLLSSSMRQESNAIQFFGTLDGVLKEAVAVPHEKIMGAPVYTRRHYRTLALDADPSALHPVRDPVSGGLVNDGQALMAAIVAKMRETMQPKEDALAGKPPGPGMRPWTQGKDDIFEALLPTDGRPGVAVPEHVFQDIVLFTQTIFDPPDSGTVLGAVLAGADTLFLKLRRGWTVHNPVHWTLTRMGDVMNNHATGKLHFADFVRSVFTGHGFYADTHRHMAAFKKWSAAGRPDVATGDLTATEVDNAQSFLEFANLVMGGTYTESFLDSNAFGMLHGALMDPDAVTKRVAAGIDAHGGFGSSPAEEVLAGINDWARRHTPLQQRFDETLLGWLTESPHAAQAKVRAVQESQHFYELFEVMAKYSAYQAIRARDPGLTKQQAAIAAAEGTGDARYANPRLLSFTTKLRSGAGALLGSIYRRTGSGRKWSRLFSNLARLFMHTPFLGWQSVMIPTKVRSIFLHPMKAVSALGMVSLLSVGMMRWLNSNPEEAQRFREAQTMNRYTAGTPLLTESEGEELLRSKTSLTRWLAPSIGMPGSRQHNAAWDAIINVMRMDPVSFRAPSGTPDTQIGTAMEFAPPTDVAIAPLQGLRQGGVMQSQDWARGWLQAVAGMLPTAGTGAWLMIDRLTNPPAGKTSSEQLTLELSQLAAAATPGLYPELYPLSRQGQTALQMSTLQGRRIEDWVEGVLPAYQATAQERLGRIMYQSLWRSSRVVPSGRAPDQRTITENLLNELLAGKGDPLLPHEEELYRDAVKRVTTQWDRIVEGNYATWVGMEHEPGDQLEAMIAREVALSLDVDLSAKGEKPVLKPLEQVRTTMGRFIQSQDAELRPYMLDFALHFLSKDGAAWANTGQPLLWEAAHARRVEPSVFMNLYRSSMADPMGFGLVQYIASYIEKHPDADMNVLWPIFATTPRPNANLQDQRKLWDATESKFRVDPTRSAFLQRPAVRPGTQPPLSDIAPKGSTLLGPAGKLLTPYNGAVGSREFLRERKEGDQ